jgi:hypothetical protein
VPHSKFIWNIHDNLNLSLESLQHTVQRLKSLRNAATPKSINHGNVRWIFHEMSKQGLHCEWPLKVLCQLLKKLWKICKYMLPCFVIFKSLHEELHVFVTGVSVLSLAVRHICVSTGWQTMWGESAPLPSVVLLEIFGKYKYPKRNAPPSDSRERFKKISYCIRPAHYNSDEIIPLILWAVFNTLISTL